MIPRLWLPAILGALTCLAPALAGEPAPGTPVVVELFTSQGCSSCPPADAYLGELAKRPGVLALGFHVDYWNYIGWADPYSMKLAADRQRDYARRLGLHYVYTPQMVIDGTREGVGSEPDRIASLLREVVAEQRPRPALSVARSGAGLHIQVGAAASAEPATIWLVGFDATHQTKVLRGENEGETAADYQVVRSFVAVGSWSGAPLDLDVAADKIAGDGCAVLLQVNGNGPIITAAKLATPAG